MADPRASEGIVVMDRFISLVKNQIAWMESQIARFPESHPRYRPAQVEMYRNLISEHQELLTYLENLAAQNEAAKNKTASTPSSSLAEARAAARTAVEQLTKPLPDDDDLSDLPPELLEELSPSAGKADSDPIVKIIKARGGTATLDDIIIDLYRKYKEIHKRNLLANRLYRLSKRGLVSIPSGRKGVYKVDTQPELFEKPFGGLRPS